MSPALALLLSFAIAGPAQDAAPTLTARERVLAGDSPQLIVSGLTPGETVRIHGVRQESVWAADRSGGWVSRPVVLDAWADVIADAEGSIDMATADPVAGSYRDPDALGLIWSGYPTDDPALAGVVEPALYEAPPPPSTIAFSLVRDGRVAASASTVLAAARATTRFTTVSMPGLTGVFAAPDGAVGLPVVIRLHGSEGGSLASARFGAAQFAARGYASLSVNYFSWLGEDPNTPGGHVEIPLETLEKARAWLAERPEVDMNRIAVHGTSKGAEFALLAASRFGWITAVVACVPTDVVWEGYGPVPGLDLNRSSWSEGGQPLPFVRLFPFVDGVSTYRTNTDRYERSRAWFGDRDARIPLERTSANVLLLGSDRDEVWASGAMIRSLQARMAAAGRGELVEATIYPTAGHQICGNGSSAARLYSPQSPDPDMKDVTAEGAAAIDAWRRTLEFLDRTLDLTP